MKRKKSEATAHRKLSFSVNREDIEIRNDWASAVIDQCRPTADTSKEVERRSTPAKDGEEERATDATVGTGQEKVQREHRSTVELEPTGELPKEQDRSPVELGSPAAPRATVARQPTGELRTTGEHVATIAPGAMQGLKPLRHLADGLTPGQFTLYTLMYEHGRAEGGEGRLFRAGYHELGRLSGLSKRGIQKILDGLEQKGALAVWNAPGYCRTETTVYRVYGPEQIIVGWQTAGYQYVVSKRRQLIRVESVPQ